MARNSLLRADVPFRNYSLTHSDNILLNFFKNAVIKHAAQESTHSKNSAFNMKHHIYNILLMLCRLRPGQHTRSSAGVQRHSCYTHSVDIVSVN